ncbi:MAG: aspartate aminotransferase family protein, partial [Anaerolineae bacterium]
MKKLLESTTARALRYLETLPKRSVAPTAEAITNLKGFIELLPDDPTDSEIVLQQLDEFGSPATMAQAGPRFFGFV